MPDKPRPDPSPDAGDPDSVSWRWVVLAASFVTMLLNAAVSYNVGVLNVAVLENFDAGPEVVSWLMAVYSAIFAITGPVASAVINASDCRTCVFFSGVLTCVGFVASSWVTHYGWLFLTLSIVGLGQSMAQVGGSVGLAYYFPTKTVFASGIALSGNGLGSFLHPALLQVLLEMYSLKGAFLILGAVCLNSCTCGLLMRPTTYETSRGRQKAQAEARSFTSTAKDLWREHVEILTDLNFLKLFLAVFTFALAYNTALVFFPECLIKAKGYTHMEAATIASFVGIGSLLARALVGFAATEENIGEKLMYIGYTHMEAATIASFVGIGSLLARALVGFAATEENIGEKLMYIGMNCVAFLVCMAADNLMNFTVGALIVALAYGIYVSPCVILFFTLSFYVLGHSKGASGYGIVLVAYGVASLLGPPLYAVILEIFGCVALFKITGLLFLSSALISTGIHQHITPEVGLDDAVVPEKLTGAIFGSRNFEFIVPIGEREKESPQRDRGLEVPRDRGPGGGEGDTLHVIPVGGEGDTLHVIPGSHEGDTRHVHLGEEEPELTRLLSPPVHTEEMI
ncbi:monocarboxylate transporter [Plakobranchus ocellatus]|uniref:Monocarboxylate transporter n=1 Tax=Plakobranchus ocellatus TaxID=259542 RepID=A0AAV3ZNH4_9GAST|nr:monocarboxylate transporter [Plakobranchus ocellatus]